MDANPQIAPEHIIKRCKSGDRKAQHELYQMYARAMFNLSFRVVNDYNDAEDALQEAFVSAFRHLHSYKGEVTFGAWLKKIVLNKSINALKRRRQLILSEELELADAHPEPAPEEITWQVERVRSAILKLPDGYRIVLTLYLLEGYDHVEIANILQISEETSKSQYSRARKRLLQIIKSSSNMEITY